MLLLHKRILKIVGIPDNDPNIPLDIKRVFIVKAILFQYEELKNEYALKPINTRYPVLYMKSHSEASKLSYWFTTKRAHWLGRQIV